jgi:hypothetical protein
VPSLRDYRRAFARSVGTFKTGTGTSGSTTNELEDILTISSVGRLADFEHAYLLRPDAAVVADKVRLIAAVDSLRGVFQPDFPPGAGWTNPPYTTGVGEVYEILSNWFHPTEDIPHFLNEALKQCFVWDEVRIPAAYAGGLYGVSPFQSWLTDPSAIFEVVNLNGSGQLLDSYTTVGGTIQTALPTLTPVTLRGRPEVRRGQLSLRLAASTALAGTSVTTVRLTMAATGDVYVTSQTSLPNTFPFWVTIGSELLKITGLSGAQPVSPAANYAAARGEGGTLATTHAVGESVALAPILSLRGRFPAYGLCRASGGRYGDQAGLTAETDEAIPDANWVALGMLVQAWSERPRVMEEVTERQKVGTIHDALLGFRRWQEVTDEEHGIEATFAPGARSL